MRTQGHVGAVEVSIEVEPGGVHGWEVGVTVVWVGGGEVGGGEVGVGCFREGEGVGGVCWVEDFAEGATGGSGDGACLHGALISL